MQKNRLVPAGCNGAAFVAPCDQSRNLPARSVRWEDRGAGLILAVIVGAILMTVGAMLARLGWDAAAGSHEAYARVQAAAGATSGTAAQMVIVREALITQMVQNILDQGCKQVVGSMAGGNCVVPGNDVAQTSGVRLNRIQTLAANSTGSWDALQQAFSEVFRQVIPLGVVSDPFRQPAVLGYGGLRIEGRLDTGTLSVPWRGYVIVAPAQGHPITYNAVSRKATVRFELRAYGWAYVDGRTGRRVTAQVTAWTTGGLVEMIYPACPSGWPDAVCSYPVGVNIQIPPYWWLHNDPAVQWGF